MKLWWGRGEGVGGRGARGRESQEKPNETQIKAPSICMEGSTWARKHSRKLGEKREKRKWKRTSKGEERQKKGRRKVDEWIEKRAKKGRMDLRDDLCVCVCVRWENWRRIVFKYIQIGFPAKHLIYIFVQGDLLLCVIIQDLCPLFLMYFYCLLSYSYI